MGIVSSSYHHRPVYRSVDAMGNISIRNLTITPLELKEAERLGKTVRATPSNGRGNGDSLGGSARLTANRTGGGTAPAPSDGSQKHFTGGIMIPPFSETEAPVPAPDPNAGEKLRLTFQEPGTDHRYVAEFPGPTLQSIVMRHSAGEITGKEFTVVYLPRARYLTILSSARLIAWMAELPSALPVSALSIPGTHNSPTHFFALPSVRCQAVGIRAQLDNGVRFLDIRVSCPDESLSDDNLALVHSAFPISLTGTKWFHDLLAHVYAFLDDNPSETVLMSIKREGTGRGSDQTLSKYLARRYFAGANTLHWYTEPRIPTLGEVRGKLVLIRRFLLDDSLRSEHGGRGLGIDGSVWPDNVANGTCGGGQIRIQDFYDVTQTETINKKIGFAQAQLERAGQQVCVPEEMPLPIYINFLSASSFFNASCWPDKIAARINPSIIEYLCTGHGAPGKGPGQLTIGDAGTGVVVMDWVGHDGDWDLVRCIVGWNARLQLKG